VRELRFDKTLYEGTQVDAALEVFGRFGSFERAEETDAWIVRIEAGSKARERRLAGEIGNYALGLTMKSRRGAGS
jgi:hypothetical protein